MTDRRNLVIGGVGAFLVLGIAAAAISPFESNSTPGSPPGSPPDYVFPYQPLWPFADQASAERWLTEGQAAGESAWHSDPAATALKFTREFLGFTDLDRATAVNVERRDAWIAVGQADPNGEPVTAARLHLVRMGPADDAPWEVVGTEDTDLTLDTPSYGSPVQQVIEVGGTISGVDESLEIQARQGSGVLGEFCCVPAGGQGSRWSAKLGISGAQQGAITLVVSTGGHVAEIERFAITALRVD